MRAYPKWVRKIKLVALYGGGGCFGLFVILVIVALVTSDNDKTASESPAASASESPAASVSESEHAGAPVNLFEAAESGTASEVKAALAAGADPNNARRDDGDTPLHLAAIWNDNPSVIAALLEGGADPDEDSGPDRWPTPLHRAAVFNSKPSVIVALIEGGADPDDRAGNGRTPLHLAAGALTPEPSVIKALIEGGANPGARDRAGKTPFDYAKDKEALKGTDAYWLLNEGRFE